MGADVIVLFKPSFDNDLGLVGDYIRDRKNRVAKNQYMASFGCAAMLRLTMDGKYK